MDRKNKIRLKYFEPQKEIIHNLSMNIQYSFFV